MKLETFSSHWQQLKQIIDVHQIEIGYINETYRVVTSEGQYIYRIYNNIQANVHIEAEIEIIEKLQIEKLSFDVPLPLKSGNGSRVVRLEDKKLATLSPLIVGRHPEGQSQEDAFAAGIALGELVKVLGTWDQTPFLDAKSPYGELDKAHPFISDPIKLINKLPTSQDKIERIHLLFNSLRVKLPSLYTTLPKQPIHGDFTKGNTLLIPNREGVKVSGVLDYEFCCHDIRALDLAIGLNEGPTIEMWGTGEEWNWIDSFGRGYATQHDLLLNEIEGLPTLMRLRIAYFILHFMGRFMEGIDDLPFMKGIVDWALITQNFIDENDQEIIKRAKEWFSL